MEDSRENRNAKTGGSRERNGGLPRQVILLEDLEIGYRQGRKQKSLTDPMNCRAGEGELIALMGRNGCGKSTLLRTLVGLQEPLGGRIKLEGRLLGNFHRRELSRLLGYISTEPIRVQGLRVRDLVAIGRYPHTGWFAGLSEQDREKIGEAISITSLGELAERDLDELSDGERQRAMIARALAQDTRILVLDEPTAYLDLTHRYEIIALLGRLSNRHGKTIVFSSHDLQLNLQVADRIWLMDGMGIREGSPAELIRGGELEKVLLEEAADRGISLDPGTGGILLDRGKL